MDAFTREQSIPHGVCCPSKSQVNSSCMILIDHWVSSVDWCAHQIKAYSIKFLWTRFFKAHSTNMLAENQKWFYHISSRKIRLLMSMNVTCSIRNMWTDKLFKVLTYLSSFFFSIISILKIVFIYIDTVTEYWIKSCTCYEKIYTNFIHLFEAYMFLCLFAKEFLFIKRVSHINSVVVHIDSVCEHGHLNEIQISCCFQNRGK